MNDADKDSITFFRTVLSNLANIAPVGHSGNLPGHTKVNTAA